jgi:hypothetical protein
MQLAHGRAVHEGEDDQNRKGRREQEKADES